MINRTLAFMFISFVVISCDSLQTDFQEKQCFRLHRVPDVYIVEKRENAKVHLRNLRTNEMKEMSTMNRGWSEVECK